MSQLPVQHDQAQTPLAAALSVRRLVEFLLRTGSIDSRFTGFDRANEGARLHRKLQRAAARKKRLPRSLQNALTCREDVAMQIAISHLPL